MKIDFVWIGETKQKPFREINTDYVKRLSHYIRSKVISVKEPKVKGNQTDLLILEEAKAILAKTKSGDFVVLCDEKGKQMSSVEFAQWFQHKMNISVDRIVFIIAGAMGAHQLLKTRADYTLSLSKMTLTHDMARMILLEQVYRAMTILRGEKYHNP